MGMSRLAIVFCLLAFAPASLAADKDQRLNYQQEQLLKDAVSYLDRVENMAKDMTARAGKMKVGDASVQMRDVDTLLLDKAEALKFMGYAESRLKQLPAAHPKVKPEADRVKPLMKSLAEIEAKLQSVKKALKGVVEQGSGAGFKADFDRLSEISETFTNARILETVPEEGIALVQQIEPMRAERRRIGEKYGDLLKQSTPQANEMNNRLKQFDYRFEQFEKAAKEYAANAPRRLTPISSRR